MGSCLTRDDRVHEAHREVEEAIKRKGTCTATDESEAKSKFDGDKSMLRLRVRRESRIVNVEPRGEVLRIKVLVTQGELKQISNFQKDFKYSSVGQSVAAMKLRRPRVCDVGTNDVRINGNWQPSLDSISEDH